MNPRSIRSHSTISPRQGETEESFLRRRFEALGPWFTQFTINGKQYGGSNSYEDDPRLEDCAKWDKAGGRVLELGSFEGAHTLALARQPEVESVLGLEGRDYLVTRANFAKEILGEEKISFTQCNVEKEDLTPFGQYDLVFCSGLLYHISEPWVLLERISQVTNHLFLSTQYASREEVTRASCRGIMWSEGPYSDPLSGLVEEAFWPSFKYLALMLVDCGFKISHARDYPDWSGNCLANFYCEK